MLYCRRRGALPLGANSALAQRRPGPNDAASGGEATPSTEQKGDPLYGYFLTGALCAAAIFAACKSARR